MNGSDGPAPQPSTIPSTLRPLSIGEILDGAFTLYRRNFLVLVGTALCALLPTLLLPALQPEDPQSPALGLLNWPFMLIAWAAAIRQVSEAALGRQPRLLDGIAVGLKRLLPLIGVGIALMIFLTIGFVLLVIPGLLLWIMLFAVFPVTVLEKRSLSAFDRSRELAKGSWGKILAIMSLRLLITAIPGFAYGMGMLFYMLQRGPPGFPGQPGPAGEPDATYNLLFVVLPVAINSLVVPFSMGVLTLLYYDQRVRKEGLDVALALKSLDSLEPPPGIPGLLEDSSG